MLLICSGCGPSKLLEVPSEIPESLNGRTLWHTPNAYIYAADQATAGETDRWIADVAEYVRREHKSELGKGLVIVVGKGEKPCIPWFDELIRLKLLAAKMSGDAPEKPITAAEERKGMEAGGMTEEMALALATLPLDATALDEAGLGPDLPKDVAWKFCCPSQGQMEAGTWMVANTAVKRELGAVTAALMAPMMPMAVAESAKVFQLARDLTAYMIWCSRQTEWSADMRKEAMDKYTEHRVAKMGPLMSLAMAEAEKKAKEKQAEAEKKGVATSQPEE